MDAVTVQKEVLPDRDSVLISAQGLAAAADTQWLNGYLPGLLKLVQQRERGQGYSPVAFAVSRFAHREIVRKRDEGYSRRLDAVLHGERDGGDTPPLYGFTYQPNGPVA